MKNYTEVKQKIHDIEYNSNGLRHLNNAGIAVRNLRQVKGGYNADILIFLEDMTERHNDCFYPFEEVRK